MSLPAIVINAYNRPKSLNRLLCSLDQADIVEGVQLVISLEGESDPEVVTLAENYHWTYGKKRIIRHSSKLGLIQHFLACGDLTEEYECIIYLEDDLFVGPGFYQYSCAVLTEYGGDPSLAGFSLNSLWFNGYLHLPFVPINDGGLTFFLQVPWYQGQVYTYAQWTAFKGWLKNFRSPDSDFPMHHLLKDFKYSDDWFPIKTQFLIETNKYYCFPRVSHCVNFGDSGTHFKNKSGYFQTELAQGYLPGPFLSTDRALAVYDSYFEILPEKLKQLNHALEPYDFETDLYGTKDLSLIQKTFVLTSQLHKHSDDLGFGLEMRPHELNIAYQISGRHFVMTENKNRKVRNPFLKQFAYFFRHKLTLKRRIKLTLQNLIRIW
ncbi:MAG: hypothetical protein RIC30_15295 [Marinoscillum sp.]|uniref:hypothetical protein n=1 Tax=Marinoscillum sp. TaxID=2024838 RepID=UPI0032FF150A